MSLLTLDMVRARTGVVRVNLLPPQFEVARRERRRQRLVLGGVALVALGCVGAGVLATSQAGEAEDALTTEQTRTVALQAQQAPYAEVPVVLQQVAEAQKIQADVSAYAVPWYAYLNRIAAATPTGVTFSSLVLNVTPPATATASTEAADPLAVQGVGTMTMSGATSSQSEVASWLEAIAGVPGIANPTLSGSTFDPTSKTLTFNATATLTDDVLLSKQ